MHPDRRYQNYRQRSYIFHILAIDPKSDIIGLAIYSLYLTFLIVCILVNNMSVLKIKNHLRHNIS